MKSTSISRLLTKGAENLFRHWITSIPAMLVIALVLTLFHGLLLIHDRAAETLKELEQKFSITVYLRDDADPFEVGNLITSLENRSDVVKPVLYTSKEAAWQLMSKTFSLDTSLLEKFKFSLPASLTITPRRVSDTARIEAFLETNAKQYLRDPLVSKDRQKNVTNQMADFIEQVRMATLKTLIFFIILFVLGGTLLLGSTIHLAITSRNNEIHIMKLVGASKTAITMPFIVEGLLLSLLAFLFHLLLVLLFPFGEIGSPLQLNALLGELVAVVMLGGAVSYLTTFLHMRKRTL